METNEHKNCGDAIRIETLNNPYLQGSENLSEARENDLRLKVMHQINGVPVPLDLDLSAGDIVALAGDYYSKAGWAANLVIPEGINSQRGMTHKVVRTPVEDTEIEAYRGAYNDLASPNVTKKNINRIFWLEKASYIPNILKQLLFSFTVEDYGNKLTTNEDHFAPWSLRAYVVGHHSALRMAEMAYHCHQLAKDLQFQNEEALPSGIDTLVKAIEDNPELHLMQNKNRQEILTELGHRFHAIAVANDLFAMHFYSDHFAGGHLSRLGLMRKSLPDQFGIWGSILVNNMHNEDNINSVEVTNTMKFRRVSPDTFQMNKQDEPAYGDGTFFERENAENTNMLINGMDNSLGDIARLMKTGHKRHATEYGGLTFMPEIDYTKRQTQPLFLQDNRGTIFVRKNVFAIQMLSPSEYQAAILDPGSNGYEPLTRFKAFTLVLKLRLTALFYAPKVDAISQEREIQIAADEQNFVPNDYNRVLRRIKSSSNFNPPTSEDTEAQETLKKSKSEGDLAGVASRPAFNHYELDPKHSDNDSSDPSPDNWF